MRTFKNQKDGYDFELKYFDDGIGMSVHIDGNGIIVWYTEDDRGYCCTVEFVCGYEEMEYTTFARIEGELVQIDWRDSVIECIGIAAMRARRQVVYKYEHKAIMECVTRLCAII